MTSNGKNQGEGDREGARKYNESAESFAQSNKGRRASDKRDHSGRASDEELAKARDEASSRAKDHDPEARRNLSDATD